MFTKTRLSDETDWLNRVREGDELAFREIYGHFWPSLYQAAYNHVRNRETAEEFVQDLFANLWLKREQLTVHTSLQGYLHTALRYQIYDYIDKQAVRQRVHADLLARHDPASYTTHETLAYNELESHLTQAVAQLPQPAQTVFRLSRYEHLSTQTIAEQLDLSPKMVEYHLTRALKLLRGQLKELITLFLLLVAIP